MALAVTCPLLRLAAHKLWSASQFMRAPPPCDRHHIQLGFADCGPAGDPGVSRFTACDLPPKLPPRIGGSQRNEAATRGRPGTPAPLSHVDWRVRKTERPGTPWNALEWWAGSGSHCGRSGPSRKGSADVAYPVTPGSTPTKQRNKMERAAISARPMSKSTPGQTLRAEREHGKDHWLPEDGGGWLLDKFAELAPNIKYISQTANWDGQQSLYVRFKLASSRTVSASRSSSAAPHMDTWP